ncbi:HET-domain-containing protein [Mycena sanguinolenta]|uniref:HET-domain-containing protein n=1 Tax=Mycena sanguinolenta TaxID=230812 RepID=A0A8H6Y009_9AGAR|nr:HET-domain-containing protein [Mycena sanguinolenta]
MTDAKTARSCVHRGKSATSGKPFKPSSSNSEDSAPKSGRAEPLLEIVQFALDLADKALDIAQVAPFVAPAAELLRKIIDSYKELKTSEENRDALARRIADLTGDICAAVLRMQETNHSDHIGRLRQDLEKYAAIINRASELVEAYDDQSRVAHFLRRNENHAEMDQLNRDLHLFATRFGNNRLVDLAIQDSMNAQTLNKVHETVTNKKLEEWLQSPPDMKDKHHAMEKLRADGTGRWLLENDIFVEWEDNSGVLWIEGPSGTGKSVLSSIVIQRLFQQRRQFTAHASGVAFFYFDFGHRETQSLEIALRRMILQLSAQSPNQFRTLDDHHKLSEGQILPNYKELQNLLRKLIQEFRRTYIVLDALDEYDPSRFNELIKFVLDIKTWTETPLHLMITSQTRDIFSENFTGINHITLNANVLQKEDINCFVTSELQTNLNLEMWKSCSTEVVKQITEKSNGMFRLASCLLKELSHCQWGEEKELEKVLETLPSDLFGIYDRFIQAIPAGYLCYAEAALRWIMFYTGSVWLELDTLVDALALDLDGPDSAQYAFKPARREANRSMLLKWLSGLIQVNEGGIIALAHSSVQDYLLSDHFKKKFSDYDLRETPSHELIARSCISYVLYFNTNPWGEPEKLFAKWPLGMYAVTRWYHHAVQCDQKQALIDLAMPIFQTDSNLYHAFCSLMGFKPGWIPPLHFCCMLGYLECVSRLVASGIDIEAPCELGSPLTVASYSNKTEVVSFLLKNGANINSVGGVYANPLVAASRQGKIDAVNLLVENGANVNLVHSKYGSALTAVCGVFPSLEYMPIQLKLDVVHILLRNGADVNLGGGEYGSALGGASFWNSKEIVQLLLDHGADVNMPGGEHSSVLAAACAHQFIYKSPIMVVRILLEKGANVKLYGSRALKEAISHRREDVVALLKNYGAVLDENDRREIETM